MTEKRTRGSLVVFTEEDDLSFVAKWLGVELSRLKIPQTPRKNNGSPKVATSRAIFETQLEESSRLSDQIESILSLLESRADSFREAKDKILNLTIFCMFSSRGGQGSAELSADLIKRLAKQPVDLVIDLYPPAGE